jgi:PTS system mannose-specific IIB component/fructoselysine and glucoselysine-specific PTS system IIB component
MSILLTRVDDRLIHGQVVIGWGRPLALTRIVLVDSGVRSSPWEQELYRLAAPAEIALDFLSPEEAAPRLAGWVGNRERVMVLVGSVATAAELLRLAPGAIASLNLGGIHAGTGRTERLSYIHLTDEEKLALQQLAQGGVEVSAQDVPSSRPVPLRELP